MTQDKETSQSNNRATPGRTTLASSYYGMLGLHPSASPQQIRQAYRELSKTYHPDTTNLPPAIATAKFQQINEAYATLSSPERRQVYDHKIGYSRINVIQPPAGLNRPSNQFRTPSSSAYLDPTDRPLSAGEIFALFILGVTFVACLVLALTIGLTKGEAAFQPLIPPIPLESTPTAIGTDDNLPQPAPVAPQASDPDSDPDSEAASKPPVPYQTATKARSILQPPIAASTTEVLSQDNQVTEPSISTAPSLDSSDAEAEEAKQPTSSHFASTVANTVAN